MRKMEAKLLKAENQPLSCKLSKIKRGLQLSNPLLADRTGLEPATSAVTGRHSNQLNYRSFSVGAAKIGEKIIQAKTNSVLS